MTHLTKWVANGKRRWPPPSADTGVAGAIADSRVNGVVVNFLGMPLISCGYTGIPSVGDGERAQAGFMWVRHWNDDLNPTYGEAQSYVANWPDGDSSFNAPDALTLEGETWAGTDGNMIIGRLDVPALQGYSSSEPLNLVGAAKVNVTNRWAHLMAYADSTDVYIRARMTDSPTGGTRDSGWFSWPIGRGVVLAAIRLHGDTSSSFISFTLNDGLKDRGLWG